MILCCIQRIFSRRSILCHSDVLSLKVHEPLRPPSPLQSDSDSVLRISLPRVNAKFPLSLLPSTRHALKLSEVTHASFKKSEASADVSNTRGTNFCFCTRKQKHLSLLCSLYSYFSHLQFPRQQDTRFRRFVFKS